MAKKTLNILAVCGSGVVCSSMIATRLEDIMKSLGATANVTGLLPNSVESYVERGGIDMAITTSPIPGDIKVPVINGVALLSGFGEEQCIEEITKVAQEILATK